MGDFCLIYCNFKNIVIDKNSHKLYGKTCSFKKTIKKGDHL